MSDTMQGWISSEEDDQQRQHNTGAKRAVAAFIEGRDPARGDLASLFYILADHEEAIRSRAGFTAQDVPVRRIPQDR